MSKAGADAHEKEDEECVWRFGYGSNIALSTLRTKKNLNPRRHVVGTIEGWQLYFSPAIQYVEPGFAKIRPRGDGAVLHGSAFLIPRSEAEGLDRQEASYDPYPSRFVSYEGEVVEGVGLYVPKKFLTDGKLIISEDDDDAGDPDGTPSLRYLRLMQRGAREAGLSASWIARLDSFDHYITPDDVRTQTIDWIKEFHDDSKRRESLWTMEDLSKHDGSSEEFSAHVAVAQYVVKVKGWTFQSWKGHCVTRRNLIHFRGRSVDAEDIRWGEEGFRPLPNVACCSEEEREYLMQNLESLLHRGGTIVARLKECIDDGGEMECC